MYLINRGAVHVLKEDALVATLHGGDYFGELALLVGEPRTASVLTATDTLLLALSVDDFHAVLNRHAEPHPRRYAAAHR